GDRGLAVTLANLVAAALVNVGVVWLAFRGLAPWQVPDRPRAPGAAGARGLAVTLANLVAAALVNVGLFWLAFRVLTPRQIPTGQLALGAAVAGIGWQVLQAVGGYLVGHSLRHAGEVCGFFAIVLGLLPWLFLGAQLALYGAEVNVVRVRRLCPRSLLQPPLTEADQRALVHLAKQEERRPEEAIEVRFTVPRPGPPPPPPAHPHGPAPRGRICRATVGWAAPPTRWRGAAGQVIGVQDLLETLLERGHSERNSASVTKQPTPSLGLHARPRRRRPELPITCVRVAGR